MIYSKNKNRAYVSLRLKEISINSQIEIYEDLLKQLYEEKGCKITDKLPDMIWNHIVKLRGQKWKASRQLILLHDPEALSK